MSESASATDVSAGALLRHARESAGMHVASLAALLKVPVPKLEALEQDRYDLLPDAVFVRALASSVCRTLKIDPQPVLQRLPQTGQPRLVQDTEHINAPFRSPNDGPAPGFLDQLSRPVVITVLALLLGAVVLVFLPYAQRGFDTVRQAALQQGEPVMPPPGAAANVPNAPVPVDVASGPEATAQSPQMPVSASGPTPTQAALTTAPGAGARPGAPATTTAAAPATATATPAAAAPATAQPAAAPAPAQPAASAQAAAPAPVDANAVIGFRTRGDSWVQVTDAKGSTVLRKLMRAGDTATASGALPLSVTVGSVQATDVEVRGKPYNLAPMARDNVARFEVK